MSKLGTGSAPESPVAQTSAEAIVEAQDRIVMRLVETATRVAGIRDRLYGPSAEAAGPDEKEPSIAGILSRARHANDKSFSLIDVIDSVLTNIEEAI